MQAVELRAELELGKRPREVHVGEDEVRLRRVVRAAEQHRLGALADELDPIEVADERVHRQRQHPLAAERVTAESAAVCTSESSTSIPSRAEGLGELGARPGRGVRHETEPVAVRPQPANRVGGALDRLT